MSTVGHDLHQETQAAKTLRAQLADIFEGDEQCATDTIEGETNLSEAIDAAVQQLVDDEAAKRGLDAMLVDLASRKARIERRIDNTRTALCVALEQAGKKKIEHPAVTLSLTKVAPKVVVTEESEIPAEFWKSGEPKLDRKALKDALKDQRDIPGAMLSNGGQTLQVRWS